MEKKKSPKPPKALIDFPTDEFLGDYKKCAARESDGGVWKQGSTYIEIWRFMGEDLRDPNDWNPAIAHNPDPAKGESGPDQWEAVVRPIHRIFEALTPEALFSKIQEHYTLGGWFQIRFYRHNQRNTKRTSLCEPLFFEIQEVEDEEMKATALTDKLLEQQASEREGLQAQIKSKELQLQEKEIELRENEASELRAGKTKAEQEAQTEKEARQAMEDRIRRENESALTGVFGLLGDIIKGNQNSTQQSELALLREQIRELKQDNEPAASPWGTPPWQQQGQWGQQQGPWGQSPWGQQQADPRMDAIEESVDKLTDALTKMLENQNRPAQGGIEGQILPLLLPKIVDRFLDPPQQHAPVAMQTNQIGDLLKMLQDVGSVREYLTSENAPVATPPSTTQKMMDMGMQLASLKIMSGMFGGEGGMDMGMMKWLMGENGGDLAGLMGGGGNAQTNQEPEIEQEPTPPKNHEPPPAQPQPTPPPAQPQPTPPPAQAVNVPPQVEGLVLSAIDRSMQEGQSAEEFIDGLPPGIPAILQGMTNLVERVRNHPEASPEIKSLGGKRWLQRVKELMGHG